MLTLVMLALMATMPFALAAYTTPDNTKIASQGVSELLSEKAIPGQVIVGFNDANVMTADERDTLIASHGGLAIDRNPALNCVLLAVGDAEGFIEAMTTEQSVKYAEPNYIAKAAYTPNDPGYSQQWGPPAIKADLAWDVQQGDYDNVKIAIVDTGIDYTHEDLGNYVSGGYDWINMDSDPWDDEGHGTHCAGIAAAVMDNDVGIAGIAQVQVMAEKVLDETGSGSDWDVSQGIIHATEEGADVISMSLGSPSASITLENACQYAWDAGCILTGAAGNDGTDTISYPARFDTVICVGAIDQTNTRCGFSNWGPEMELVAPGLQILSTTPGNSYESWDGTSMATPYVSGVAALVWSNCPGLTNQQVRDQMDDTADDLGPAGWDQGYGHGRVDAEEAIICGQIEVHVSISTDSFEYFSGDTMIRHLEIDNPTTSPVTFNMYLGVPQMAYWGTIASASIPAGFSYSDDLPFPVGDWGSTPFGMVWYVELTDGTGEVLDGDVATCAYSPYMAVGKTSDAVGAIEESIRKAGQ